jgi:Septum formation
MTRPRGPEYLPFEVRPDRIGYAKLGPCCFGRRASEAPPRSVQTRALRKRRGLVWASLHLPLTNRHHPKGRSLTQRADTREHCAMHGPTAELVYVGDLDQHLGPIVSTESAQATLGRFTAKGRHTVEYSAALTVSVLAILTGTVTGCSGMEPGASHSSATSAVAPKDSTATASPNEEGRSPAAPFKAGDCLKDALQSGQNAMLVDCSELHVAEVWVVFMLPDGPYPGDAVVRDYKKKCGPAAFAGYAPGVDLASMPTGHGAIKYPDANSWAQGDRSVSCIVDFDPPRTGSVRIAS